MNVGQLLDQIRGRYLTQFRQAIAKVQQAGMQAIPEAAYRGEDGTLARNGILNLPIRIDIVGSVDDEVQTIRVDSDSCLSFEIIDFEWGGSLLVRLAPFHWDGCQVRATGIPKSAVWIQIRAWFDRWFDGDDTNDPDVDGIFGVIHFLSDPSQEGRSTIFEVDFGSAPVEAFEEFLDALRDTGATKVEIGNRDASEQLEGADGLSE